MVVILMHVFQEVKEGVVKKSLEDDKLTTPWNDASVMTLYKIVINPLANYL